MLTDRKDLAEKRLSGEKIFDGRVLHVERDQVLLPDGSPAVREVVRHIGAAAVLPLTKEGNVLLVRQFRYPFADTLLEIPAGKRDSFDENPDHTAKRELEEEIGVRAGKWTPFGKFYSSPAILDEVIWLYLAEDLTIGERHLDDDEFIEPVSLPLEELCRMVLSGEIPDGKTQTAVLRVQALLEKRKNSDATL